MAGLVLRADARHIPLRDASVHCVVTSPPYWGLRDYGLPPTIWGNHCQHEWTEFLHTPQPHGDDGSSSFTLEGSTITQQQTRIGKVPQARCNRCGAWRGALGLEPSPELYVSHVVEVFREVRRILRRDGTLWLNLGDSYCSIGHKKSNSGYGTTGLAGGIAQKHSPLRRENNAASSGCKHKDLIGIPWRVALALQADGWYLRSDIIWAKANPMPESVRDRPTRAHEYLFLLTKSERYYYDATAIAEPCVSDHASGNRMRKVANGSDQRLNTHLGRGFLWPKGWDSSTGNFGLVRNKRSVWTIATQPYKGSHFATFPEKLIEPCILAGCPEGGIVLDPFAGSGTVGAVALRLNRRFILIDLKYHELMRERLQRAEASAPVEVR